MKSFQGRVERCGETRPGREHVGAEQRGAGGASALHPRIVEQIIDFEAFFRINGEQTCASKHETNMQHEQKNATYKDAAF